MNVLFFYQDSYQLQYEKRFGILSRQREFADNLFTKGQITDFEILNDYYADEIENTYVESEDKINCLFVFQIGMYTTCAFDCFSDIYCIDRSLVCDRYKNCPNNVDEANCEYSKNPVQ